jgi:cystathionine beta-lyase/cystathionine gamma-synthase
LKTLALRRRAHSENAHRIATWLADRSDVERVYFPCGSAHVFEESARHDRHTPRVEYIGLDATWVCL